MIRITVYLPEELKHDLKRIAQARGCSEANLIRQGIRPVVEEQKPVRPQIPLFESGDPTLAERVDELLEGFGQR